VRVVVPSLSVSWHGGIRVLLQIANHLVDEGHQVDLFISRGRFNSPFQVDRRVAVRHVGIKTRWKYLDYTVFLLLLPFAVPRRSILLATFFVTYFPVRIAAFLRRAPHVYFVQDIESKYRGPIGSLLNLFCRLSYHDNNIIAANEYLRRRLREEFGASSQSIDIGPGVPFFTQKRTTEHKLYDVIYFLRREPWKGLERFAEIQRLAAGGITFLCLSQDQELLAAITGPSVTCFKPKDDAELISQMDRARLFLLTSFKEGFGLPPLEAMARGIPPVLFPCGGPDLYMVDRVNGRVVDSPAQALDAIRELLRDSELYLGIQRQCAATASFYNMDIALKRITVILLEYSEQRWPRTAIR
jgi:glycosyltransferase involved in cell wall biosynthesis